LIPRRKNDDARNILPETTRDRPSGVRTTAERIDREERAADAPTLPPPPSLRDVRDASAPLEELLYRFEVGDHKGALAAAETLLDQRLVPTLAVPFALLSAMGLDTNAMLLLTSIDGCASLETVLESSGVPMIDALRALCRLLEERIITLR
jgi:hypothetical protein